MRTHSQRLLSMVLALSMLLTFLPLSAFAESTPPPTLTRSRLSMTTTTTTLIQTVTTIDMCTL